MPSLKMKAKSIKDHSKDDGLHTCNKSRMISKKPLSHGRCYQNTERSSTCTPCNQDGETSVSDEVCILDLGGDEIIHEESSNEENLLQMHLLNVDESSTVDSMEPTPSTFSSNIESTYSPISDSMDFYNNEGLLSEEMYTASGSDSLYVPQLDSEDSDDGSRSSCGYQACNASNFYISDMIFSGSSNEISSGTAIKTDSVLLPDCKCEDSSLYCELMQEYIALPFLDDALDTGCDPSGRPSEENIVDAENSGLYMAIHQLRPNDRASDTNTYPDQDYEGFDPQLYIRNLSDQQDILPSNLTLDTKQNIKHITLVLDLDETLVHSTLDHCDDADFTFPVFFNMKEHTVFVKKRPHLHTFLGRVAEMFEIVIFTASQSFYAEQLLDILDPDGKIISRRAYRESCIFSEGNYMKDLTVLGVDLAKVAIIDNTPQVFSLQVNNGIPIKSWFDDPSDCALVSLLPFLETLVDVDDVRPIIARKFGNKE